MSPYGAHDMAGNVFEWVDDWFDARYYETAPERDPAGPDTGSRKIVRGGAWHTNWVALRTARRVDSLPGPGSDVVGLRCARTAPAGG